MSNKDYTNQIQILHFSDIHFGKHHICNPQDPSGSKKGIKSLASLILSDLNSGSWTEYGKEETPAYLDEHDSKSSDIANVRQKNTPLLLAVTGDFTQMAAQKEFDEASEFLNAFANQEILGKKLPKENIFMIPGNHDVKFEEESVETRFQPYCSFYNKFYKGHRPHVNPDEAINISQVHTLTIPNEVTDKPNKILVAEINCCMYVEKDTVDSSRGQVDEGGINKLREELEILKKKEDFNDYIKIAMIHHHVVLLPSFIEYGRGIDSVVNARMLLQLLSEFNFHVILHGHKHYPQIFSYDPVSSWIEASPKIPQLILASGSCGSRELPDETSKACNTYSLITIKWHPDAYQARINILTRGITRNDDNGRMPQGKWKWNTVNITDKKIAPYEFLPKMGSVEILDYDPSDESKRSDEYKRLRTWHPVAEVMPSLITGQAYEVNAWLILHRPEKYTYPKLTRVEWSAGPLFQKQICYETTNNNFRASFHYWGPMLLQAKLIFEDGYIVFAHIYSRMPQKLPE